MVERIDRQVENPARPHLGLDAVRETHISRIQPVTEIRRAVNRLASALK
jgi:hypothetical protein